MMTSSIPLSLLLLLLLLAVVSSRSKQVGMSMFSISFSWLPEYEKSEAYLVVKANIKWFNLGSDPHLRVSWFIFLHKSTL